MELFMIILVVTILVILSVMAKRGSGSSRSAPSGNQSRHLGLDVRRFGKFGFLLSPSLLHHGSSHGHSSHHSDAGVRTTGVSMAGDTVAVLMVAAAITDCADGVNHSVIKSLSP